MRQRRRLLCLICQQILINGFCASVMVAVSYDHISQGFDGFGCISHGNGQTGSFNAWYRYLHHLQQ